MSAVSTPSGDATSLRFEGTLYVFAKSILIVFWSAYTIST
jgi:hypothetical protein